MAGAAVTPAKSTPNPPSPTGQQLVDQASKYIGSPYVYAGNPYSVGQLLTDCSGLVDRVFADLGAKLPGARPTTKDLVAMGTAVPDLAHAQPGDLVFLEGGDHVGIYAGNNKMIDDPQPGQSVHLGNVYQTPVAIRRLTATPPGAPGSPPAGSTAAAAASPAAAVITGLTGYLDSVALRVGFVVFGAVLVLVGLDLMVPGKSAVGQLARRGAQIGALA